MVDKETVLDWGVCLTRHLQVLAASFPDHFLPDQVAELKRDCFYGGLPKRLKAMVAYLKVGVQVRTYFDYLRATQEAEKEESIELPQGPRTQVTNAPPKPRGASFFPLRKLKGNQPTQKMPAVHLAHLGRRGHQWQWRPGEWWSQMNQGSHGRVHGMLGKGCQRCPSGWEVLLPL